MYKRKLNSTCYIDIDTSLYKLQLLQASESSLLKQAREGGMMAAWQEPYSRKCTVPIYIHF